MSFADLYHYCQGLEPKIDRNDIRAHAVDFAGNGPVRTMKTTMDPALCRGFYLSARNSHHRFVQQHGTNVIVLPREGLNYCWERFIFVKELMHLFDNPDQAADTGNKFEQMLTEILPGASEPSPATLSEFDAFWMALSVFCPEALRLEFAAARTAEQLDDYAIALRLRMPQQYVQRYFEPRYRPIIDRLIAAP